MKSPSLFVISACIALGSATADAEGPPRAPSHPEQIKVACLDAAAKGQQLRDRHKLIEARDQFRICAAGQCPAAVRNDCTSWLPDVEKALPTIIFSAKDASGADLSGVKVTMDGNLLTDRLEGVAVPIDPGDHAFTFEAAGQPPIERRFVVLESQKDRHEVVTFGVAAVATRAPPPTSAETLAPPPVAHGGLGAQRVLALLAGGVGIAGLAVGTVFGVESVSTKNDAQRLCPTMVCPTQAGINEWADVSSQQTAALIGFVAGGVGLVGGMVLWFTAPGTGGGASARVSFGPGRVQVTGSW